ncbi:MAG TPA: hypothetical protein VIN59_03880 [Alphaproteobacteria bacterium]
MKLMVDHARLFSMLAVVPLALHFIMMVAIRFTGGATLFWLPLFQTPANFVLGLQCALIIRFLMLQEFPLIADDEQRRARNIDALQAATVYTIVMYLFNGLMALMMYAARRMEVDPVAMAPYTPFMMMGLVVVAWSMRWFWLHVPVALGWDVKGLYERLKGWQGSLRIGALFIICSLIVNVITALVRYMLLLMGQAGPLKGVRAVLDDFVVSISAVALAVLFACATAHALKAMLKKQVTV